MSKIEELAREHIAIDGRKAGGFERAAFMAGARAVLAWCEANASYIQNYEEDRLVPVIEIEEPRSTR